MKEFFEKLSDINNIKRKDIVEKDYHLQLILGEITRNQYLRSNLIFKGGACLIKGYIDYVRFSEDLDFSWKKQTEWQKMSSSKIKNQCSKQIDNILPIFSKISKNIGLTFEGNKENPDEVHISSGGRMVDLYLHYYSEILGVESSIKIQLNFLEKHLYSFNNLTLKPYASYDDEELRFIFKEQIEKYLIPITLYAYKPEEIYIEKGRALLTRKTFKLRDLIDLYFLERKFQYTIDEFKHKIIQKTLFALENYERYRKNIERIIKPDFSREEELKLLLVPLPKNFKEDLKKIYFNLQELRDEMLNRMLPR